MISHTRGGKHPIGSPAITPEPPSLSVVKKPRKPPVSSAIAQQRISHAHFGSWGKIDAFANVTAPHIKRAIASAKAIEIEMYFFMVLLFS